MHLFYIALHATLPAALIVAVLVHLCGPAWLPPLAQRPVWAVWVLIGVWVLMAACATWFLRTLALWRVSLTGAGLLLVAAGGVGLAQAASFAPAMLMGLTVLALMCGGVAAFIGQGRVQAHRPKRPQQATANQASPGHSQNLTRRRALWLWVTAAEHRPFLLVAVLAVESFRLAHIVATEPARSSGLLGLLLAFFVALPAATLRVWAPRIAAVLWCLAAVAFVGLAIKSGLVHWAVAAVLCIAATLKLPASLQRLRRSKY